MWIEFFGRISARFNRGSARISLIFSVIGLLTFAKVWQSTFEYYGISIWFVIIGIPTMFILVCTLIGFLEEKYKLWEQETLHIWELAGWNPKTMTGNVEDIKASIAKIEKKLEKIEERRIE